MNTIENSATPTRDLMDERGAVIAGLRGAKIDPKTWQTREDIDDVVGALRQYSSKNLRDADRIWDEEVSAKGQRPSFLTPRDQLSPDKGGPHGSADRLASQARSPAVEETSPSLTDPVRTGSEPTAIEKQLQDRYFFNDGVYHFKDRQRGIAFVDRRDQLVSPTDDISVIPSMLDLAQDRGWTSIRVAGSKEFKRNVWLAAQARGMETNGYEPSERDLAELKDRLKEAVPLERTTNSISRDEQIPISARQSQYLHALGAQLASEGASGKAIDKVVRASKDLLMKDRTYVGHLIDHGSAPYKNEPNESRSYFAKLMTDKGLETVWGIDLERSFGKGQLKIGDEIAITHKGSKSVEITDNVLDGSGNVTGTTTKTVNRHVWDASSVRELPPKERTTALERAAQTSREPTVQVLDRQTSPALPVNHPAPVPQRSRELQQALD